VSVDGPDAPPPPEPGRQTPPALLASSVLGLVGAIFLLAGLFSGSVPVVVVGVGLAALSLGAALVWRSQLIEEWRRQQPPPTSR
jgi:hypothetical protein